MDLNKTTTSKQNILQTLKTALAHDRNTMHMGITT